MELHTGDDLRVGGAAPLYERAVGQERAGLHGAARARSDRPPGGELAGTLRPRRRPVHAAHRSRHSHGRPRPLQLTLRLPGIT